MKAERGALRGTLGLIIAAAVEAAKLKVHIGAEFPLADAARAHQRLAAGHVIGKIVLRM